MTKEYIELSMEEFFEDYLKDYGLSVEMLATDIRVPASLLRDVFESKKKIDVDLDLRLCKYYEQSEGFFMKVQQHIDKIAFKNSHKNFIDILDTIIPVSIKHQHKEI